MSLLLLLLPLVADHVALVSAAHVVQVLAAGGPPVLFSSHDSGGGGELALLLAGPVTGGALYGGVYRYYRNADKTDQFERETVIALKDPISGDEQKVDEVRGTRDRRIEGDNSGDFRSRVAELDRGAPGT